MNAKNLLFVLLILPLTLWAQTGAGGGLSPENIPVRAAPFWELNLNETILDLPHLQAQSVVIAGENGRVRSYSMNGNLVWNFDPRGRVSVNSSRSPEGTSYISNEYGSFIAINRIGIELWRAELGAPASFSAIIGWDGRLFIPVGSTVFCRTASGQALWSQALESPFAAEPVLDHAGGLTGVLENQDFVRINHFGKIERLHLDRQPAVIVPIIEAGSVPGTAAAGSSFLLLYQNGETESVKIDFNAPSGSVLSRTQLPNLPAQPAAAVGYKDEAAITLRDGRLLLISGVTGQVRWNGNTHETTAERGTGNIAPGNVTMVFDERGVFSLSRIGATAFTKEGKRRWIFRLPETATIPVLSDEGIVYAAGKDNVLRAYKIDTQVRNLPHAPYYGFDPEGNYGLGSPPPSPWSVSPNRYDEAFVQAMHDEIDAATRSGQVGENETAYVAYLMEAISLPFTQPNASLIRATIKVPERIDLIRLLARMGSRDTIPFLVNIYNRDPEPSLKAACTEAIGKIGVDPRGEAISAYSFLLSRDNANLDSQLLLSASDSIAALCRFSGPPLAGAGILLLTQIARFPDFRSDVRNRAQAQLNALRQEGVDRVIQ